MIDNLTDVQKTRILHKLKWEGGLLGYIDYGVARLLYERYKREFDYWEKQIEKFDDYNDIRVRQDYIRFENKVLKYLTVDNNFSWDELNEVNYILDT